MDGATLKIAIRCTDLPASRDFYRDIVALTIVDEWQEAHGSGCVFAVGDAFLELGEHTSGDPSGYDSFDIELSVPDVDEWVRKVGGRWKHSEPKTQPWGERTVRLRDPDGILIVVYEGVDT